MSPPLQILIVEDSPTDSDLLTRSLKHTLSIPPCCSVAKRLDEALRMASSSTHDLIITDLNLPDSAGLKTFSKLKVAAGDTPIVILSGLEDVELAVEALKLGAEDYLVKGGRPELLGRVARFAVERSRRVTAERSLKKANETLQLAHEIQQSLYPTTGPVLESLDIAGGVYSAERACGDYFDFIERPDKTYSIVLGDVSGHGLPAALYMLQVRACLQLLATQNCPIEETISYVNNTIVNPSADSITFMTLFCMTLDPVRKTLQYAGAGHQGYLIRADKSVTVLKSTGLAAGFIKDADPPEGSVNQLQTGDIVFMPTDGFEEACTADSVMFGRERLLELVEFHRNKQAAQMIESLFDTVRDFTGPVEQADDMTAVVIKVL